ncbi:MAG TPA: vWA domain-containing protein [Trebonia sp.]|nr:vWA domain-containing protein [Trebonia sp.]
MLGRTAVLLGATVAASALAVLPARAGSVEPDPPAANVATVQSTLGVAAVPAELVFLVDVSDSMSATQGGLYPQVKQALSAYLAALRVAEPQDRVAVITFGRHGSANLAYPEGPPTGYINLPADATEGSTDFGDAFSLALSQFSPSPPSIKFGGLFLLSDGKNDPAGDPAYQDYHGQAWQALQERAAALPIPVTGYAVPLTINAAYISDQGAALGAVFGDRVTTLPGGTSNLPGALRAASQDVLNKEVASQADADSGKGVAVTWGGLPAAGGTPLPMRSPGEQEITVTLRALTAKVPLYLVGPRLSSPGIPLTMSWHPPPVLMLPPGRPVTLPVRLSWQRDVSGVGLSANGPAISGHLLLSGQVKSTFTPTLQAAFSDMTFSAGSLSGSDSASLSATTATANVSILLIIIVIVLILAAGGGAFLTRLRGTLTLTSVDGDRGDLRLGPLPWRLADTNRLIRQPGRISVRRSPLGRDMRVSLRLAGKRADHATLRPGERTMLVGIDIVHAQPGMQAKRDRW